MNVFFVHHMTKMKIPLKPTGNIRSTNVPKSHKNHMKVTLVKFMRSMCGNSETEEETFKPSPWSKTTSPTRLSNRLWSPRTARDRGSYLHLHIHINITLKRPNTWGSVNTEELPNTFCLKYRLKWSRSALFSFRYIKSWQKSKREPGADSRRNISQRDDRYKVSDDGQDTEMLL